MSRQQRRSSKRSELQRNRRKTISQSKQESLPNTETSQSQSASDDIMQANRRTDSLQNIGRRSRRGPATKKTEESNTYEPLAETSIKDNHAVEPPNISNPDAVSDSNTPKLPAAISTHINVSPISAPYELVKLNHIGQDVPSNHFALDLDLSISGVARIFATHFHDSIVYIPSVGWHMHEGHIFERVEKNFLFVHVEQLIREVIRLKTQTSFRPKELLDAEKLLTPSKMKPILELAKLHLTGAIDAFDNQTGVLNTPIEMVHIDGSVTHHSPEYQCRKCTSVGFDSNSQCPLYERILDLAFMDDQEARERFLLIVGQIAFGQCDKRLVLLKGAKTIIQQIIRPIQMALGTYTIDVSVREAMVVHSKIDLNRFIGARAAVCTTQVGQPISEADFLAFLFKETATVDRKEAAIPIQMKHTIIADESLTWPTFRYMEIQGFAELFEVVKLTGNGVMKLSWSKITSPSEQAGILRLLAERVSTWQAQHTNEELGSTDTTLNYSASITYSQPEMFIRKKGVQNAKGILFSELYEFYEKFCRQEAAEPWSKKAFGAELARLEYTKVTVRGEICISGLTVKRNW